MSLKTLSYSKQSKNSFSGFRSSGTSVAVGDPYWNQVELCLLSNGTHNQNNNTFIDSSTNNITFTRTGDVTQGSNGPFSDTSSALFDGTGDYLTYNGSSSNAFGTNDFTVECWVYLNSTSNQAIIAPSTGSNYYFSVSSTAIRFDWNQALGASQSATIGTGVWRHVAWSRSSGTLKMFVDGTQVYSATNNNNALGASSIIIGSNGGSVEYFNGFISDLRIVKGTALYTGNFTTPTSKLTAITNTSLLMNFANGGVVDSSKKKITAYTAGDSKISTIVSKYGNGSIYFDGTSDYIKFQTGISPFSTLGADDWTFEAWIYPTVSGTTQQCIFSGQSDLSSNAGSAYAFYIGSTSSSVCVSTTGYTFASPQPTINTWSHVAYVRSGTSVKSYLNGVQVGSVTISGSLNVGTSTYPPSIGGFSNGTSVMFTGYMDDLRITKGIARYITTFTPPQQESLTFYSPPTYDEYTYNGEVPVSGDPFWYSTQLLLRGNAANGLQNSVIIDRSSNAFTITNAGTPYQGSFAPYTDMFSAYFDGASSLSIPTTTALSFSTGDFTIEAWVYQPSFANASIIDARATPTGAGAWALYAGAAGYPYFYDGTSYTSTVICNAGVWNHIAVSRSSGTLKIFVNGVQGYSGTVSGALDRTAGATIGARPDSPAGTYLTGYISDLRVVKGTAVYTSNFTPSTTKLTAISGTSLLLNFDNVGIYDSANKINLSTAGTAAISTVYKKYGAGSMYFDGSSYVTSPNNSNFNLGSGNFTIEAWVMLNSLGSERAIVAKHNNQAGNGEWLLAISATNFPIFYYSVTGTNLFSVTGSTAVTANTWHHIAIVRNGSSFTIYLNGISGGTATDTSSIYSSTTALNIGRYLATAATTGAFLGYIDDVRITKGIARYTGNFTPPTQQLPNYYEEGSSDPYFSNVSLLLHGDGSNNANNATIVDSSSNNFTITKTGSPSQGSVSPFPTSAGTTEYTIANNGGSIYFNGTTDYITAPYNTAWQLNGATFTIEFWMYPTGNASAYRQIVGVRNAGGTSWQITISNANTLHYYDGASYNTAAAISLNTWYHVALVRNGTTMTVYLNGASVYSNTLNPNTTADGQPLGIGANQHDGTEKFAGYLSNLRIVKGTAVYTGAFTVPNTPLTAITNTQLLLKGENSAIYDSTTKNNLIVSGDTKTMVAINKYGGSSIYFDGVGDWITAPHSTNLTFGSNDFTIECWVYTSGPGNPCGIWGKKTISGYGIALQNYLLVPSLTVSVNGTTWGINASSSISIVSNTWTHLAVTRSGNTYTLWVNGQSGYSGTLAGTVYDNSLPFVVGNVQNDGAYVYSGYIDDFRFTNGISRYNSSFVPPTAAFKNK